MTIIKEKDELRGIMISLIETGRNRWRKSRKLSGYFFWSFTGEEDEDDMATAYYAKISLLRRVSRSINGNGGRLVKELK